MRALLLAVFAVVAMFSGIARAQIEPVVLARVDIDRVGATCVGAATYRFEPTTAALKTDLGTTTRTLPIVVPCARMDEVVNVGGTGFKTWPNTRAGQLSFTLERLEFYLRADGTVAIDAVFARTATDSSVATVFGTQLVRVQYKNNAAARITNALVGALVRSGVPYDWPTSVVAVPLPPE